MPRLEEPQWATDELAFSEFAAARGIDEDAAAWVLFEQEVDEPTFTDPDLRDGTNPSWPDEFDDKAVIPW